MTSENLKRGILGAILGRVNLLDTLNPAQRKAAEHIAGPLLVLAGAGSGKTRVLTHRIVNLILSGEAFPGEIFAVTFTNKAAREMLERVEKLLAHEGVPVDELWISTFHSSGARFLRRYAERLGLQPSFTILDDADQLTLIKQSMQIAGVSDKLLAPRTVQYRLNQLKNEALDPREFKPLARSFVESHLSAIFRAYEEGLVRNNSVDFGDLLLKTYFLMRDHREVREEFQERYRYLLVDEYQDTNQVQYSLLALLTEKYRNLCVVGDEDQCIYRWRGAHIRNILDFEKDFPDAQIVKLEENYRSTGHIIRAANGVIANNTERKPKRLFTSQADGDPVEVHILESDIEEARWMGREVQRFLDNGRGPQEIAVFYRTNAQSRLLEDALRIQRIHYRVYGGLKFYDRAEVKDALAYLRLFVNPQDELSLGRIINVPTRGIGKTTWDQVKEWARSEQCPLLEAVGRMARGEAGELGAAPRKKLGAFLSLYARLQEEATRLTPREFYALMLEEVGYLRALKEENTIEAQTRIENLEELATALVEYETRAEDPSVAGFLEEVALVTDMDKADLQASSVTLMTVHSAKGLEFPVVFLVGLEEELFPSARALAEDGGDGSSIEEERRLCYVGMTRARERLFLSSAKMRRVFGVTHVRSPSRFLKEIPEEECVWKDHAPRAAARRTFSFDSDFGDSFQSNSDDFGGAFESGEATDDFSMGSKVKHPDYGVGRIVKREGRGESLKLSILFDRWGTKKFLAKFAPLERL